MTTTIYSNGSKWAGELPDSIEDLIAVLEGPATLDPLHEEYGNFIDTRADGTVSFFGNFFDLSHVFRVVTDDVALIDRLTRAIRLNQSRPAYAEAKKARAKERADHLAHEAKMRKQMEGWRP